MTANRKLLYYTNETNLDSNVVMVLSFLIFATVCSIGFNFLIKCVINCCCSQSEEETGSATQRGIKRKALKSFPVVKYSKEMKMDSECVICLSEFGCGECVKVLPKCNHGFHVGCIDKWLKSNSSCPKCRNCLVDTCKKIVGCSQVSPVTTVVVVPLEREGMVGASV